jgi:glutamyl-tRNA synthetase
MLHIGGARTALFNYLFARHHGGAFLLRIEDTDRARSTQAAVDVILDGLAWLDLPSDAPPVFQSSRATRHAEVAHALLEQGRAYRCYATADELREMRERAVAEGRPPRYDGRWRDRDPADAPRDTSFSIRLRAPDTGETVIDDLVQGPVRVANAELDDMIILRSDGSPTYLHAVVVDDHDMDITHVIRGDDHLTNTFRQAQLFDAMDWSWPRFGHVPLIHGADGAKLSKRHGAQSVTEFRDMGVLPEALCNYLVRLGWGHGDAEILSRDEQIALFDITGVGRAPSRLDPAKLAHLNGVWLRRADDERLVGEVEARLSGRAGIVLDDTTRARIAALMPTLKERATDVNALADGAAFAARNAPIPIEPKAAALLTTEAKAMLAILARSLAEAPFNLTALDALLRFFAEEQGLKLGQVAQPLRAALTGSSASPPIDAVLVALGRDEVLARLAAL